MNVLEQIDAVVASIDFGVASAVKRGRNPAYPYVPVIKYPNRNSTREQKSRNPYAGVAYRTREEAVAKAQACIDASREHLRRHLADPRTRAYREQLGLPRELPKKDDRI